MTLDARMRVYVSRCVHLALCSPMKTEMLTTIQLKFLYVAITRARDNVIFMDRSLAAEPMKVNIFVASPASQSISLYTPFSLQNHWLAQNLIKIGSNTDKILSSFAKRSSPEEWARQAEEYWNYQQWEEAQDAYRRALMPREEGIAAAYALQANASTEVLGSKARSDAFVSTLR